jgi:hypothetical protein
MRKNLSGAAAGTDGDGTLPAQEWRTVRTTIDSRLAFGLLLLSVLSLAAFVAVGFRPLSSRKLRDSETLPAEAAAQAGTEFVDVTEAWGLGNNRHDTGGANSIADAIAPGVALLDLDGDGDLDLVQLNGPTAKVGLTVWINQRKESRQTRFVDKTEELGIRWSGAAQGICAGDVDNDGDVDLFVTVNGPNLLLLNQLVMKGQKTGQLRFDDVTEQAGVAGGRWHWSAPHDPQAAPQVLPGAPTPEEGVDMEVPEFSTGATFGDFDGDGDLDLYVVNYVAAFDARWQSNTSAEQADRPEKIQFQPLAFDALPDRFYVNETGADGQVRFREVTAEAGIDDQHGRGLTASFMRIEDRIYPDIYVVTDASDNVFFHNVPAKAGASPARPAGVPALTRHFEDATDEFGLSDRRSGMGLARGDADSDGDLDLLTTNWRNESVSLFLYRFEPRLNLETNEENGFSCFDERGARAGLDKDTAPLIGWGCVFFDYDDDGDEDLFVGNGSTSPRAPHEPCGVERALLFKNRGDGVFDNVTASAGAALQLSYGARGVVAGDIDRDGDLDLVIAQNNLPLVVLENRRPANGNQSLTIVPKCKLRGDATNFKLMVEAGRLRLVREILSGSSYLSQEPFEAHFGLGRSPFADRLQMTWPWLDAPPPAVRYTVPAGFVVIEQGRD